jgi:hypothetical protein
MIPINTAKPSKSSMSGTGPVTKDEQNCHIAWSSVRNGCIPVPTEGYNQREKSIWAEGEDKRATLQVPTHFCRRQTNSRRCRETTCGIVGRQP